MGLSRHAKKFHVLRRIFPMFWRGSPGMMSYNAQKETYLRDLLPNDLIHGQLKREVLIQEEVTRVWVILISESVCFLEREFCQIWRSVAGRPPCSVVMITYVIIYVSIVYITILLPQPFLLVESEQAGCRCSENLSSYLSAILQGHASPQLSN